MPNYDEYFVIVNKTGAGLEAYGCVTRELAHSEFRIPHASVTLVPIFQTTGEVLIHKRSTARKISGDKLDFLGGHVTFDLNVLAGPEALAALIEKTALREAREELWLARAGQPFIITPNHICRFTEFGELASGFDDPASLNVEFATGFILFLPEDVKERVADEDFHGRTETLDHQRIALDEMLEWFKQKPDGFAEGAVRILSHLIAPPSAISEKFRTVLAKGCTFND